MTVNSRTAMQGSSFGEQFRVLTGNADPFPWQEELFNRLMANSIERSLDLPTGLGKTAVMEIGLLATSTGASIPRRLIYIVDRRAVVDQATEVANTLREAYVGRGAQMCYFTLRFQSFGSRRQ